MIDLPVSRKLWIKSFPKEVGYITEENKYWKAFKVFIRPHTHPMWNDQSNHFCICLFITLLTWQTTEPYLGQGIIYHPISHILSVIPS
jgi:hypothetical protein